MYNHTNYKALVTAVCTVARHGDMDAEEDLTPLQEAFRSFLGYVFAAAAAKYALLSAAGQESDEPHEELPAPEQACSDSRREAAAHARDVNRIASYYGVGPVFEGNAARCRDIAEFCIELTNAFFRERRP